MCPERRAERGYVPRMLDVPQSPTSPSSAAAAMVWPSGLNVTELTACPWPAEECVEWGRRLVAKAPQLPHGCASNREKYAPVWTASDRVDFIVIAFQG